ncbi:hypothetical protein J3E73DRAFT_394664 [Bipolaris maydis]|nr:hypothetical protein J3E73DRAFT_394664 [Bipolaris maydis]
MLQTSTKTWMSFSLACSTIAVKVSALSSSPISPIAVCALILADILIIGTSSCLASIQTYLKETSARSFCEHGLDLEHHLRVSRHCDGPAYLTDFKIDYAFTDMVDGAITALVKTFVEIASAKMQAPVTWVEEFSVQGGSFVKSESASFIDHFLFKDIKQPPSQNDFSCHTGYFRVE